MKKTILEIRNLILSHETKITPDIEDTIESTQLGNPGGLRYSHVRAVEKARCIKPLHFFPLRRGNQLLSVMALAERITHLSKNEYPTYYVRYVSFNPKLNVKSLKQEKQIAQLQQLGNSIVKKGMLQYATEIPFTLKLQKPSDKKVFYAYVEESNLRSMQFTRFFFERIRSISVTTFSRFFQKPHAGVEKLNEADKPAMIHLLNKQYAHHSFYFLNEDELSKQYYTLKQNNKIVAGVKAGKAQWKIEYLPGLMGKVLQKLVPHIPIIRRIFRNGIFTFLTFDTIYCNPGNKFLLPKLLEAVCAHEKVYAGMIYMDNGDPMFTPISHLKNMGFLNKLYKGATVALLARFINFSQAEKDSFTNSPSFVSGYDLT